LTTLDLIEFIAMHPTDLDKNALVCPTDLSHVTVFRRAKTLINGQVGAFSPRQKPGYNRLNSKRMTKQQLIEQVSAKTELKKSEAEIAVDCVLALIAEALRSNERVDLRGFGSFVVKERKERQGRNPRTGETITIAAKRDASFKPSKELTATLALARRLRHRKRPNDAI
jgi:DNA-binding protein HU-beta